MKKILITGANGFLGKSLRKMLSKYNFSIIATGLGQDRISSHSHVYEEMDVRSKERCEYILNKYMPDIIVHSAAFTDVDKSEVEDALCFDINTFSILNFIPYLTKTNSHFIHISTDFVFDGNKGSYLEEDQCNPLNVYGHSKLESEKLLLQQPFQSTILRTSLLYGKDNHSANFFTWVTSNLARSKQLNIVDDQYRTPTFVDDLTQVILSIMNKKKYGTYHISSGEVLSIYQIVCNIAKHCGFHSDLVNSIKSERLNQLASRPLDSTLSIEKAVRELDFNPTNFNNALKELL